MEGSGGVTRTGRRGDTPNAKGNSLPLSDTTSRVLGRALILFLPLVGGRGHWTMSQYPEVFFCDLPETTSIGGGLPTPFGST